VYRDCYSSGTRAMDAQLVLVPFLSILQTNIATNIVVVMSERCKQAVSRKVARFILQYACVLDVLHLSRHMSCVIATY